MKYLKLFDSYRNKEILDEVEDIKLILQDFKDDYLIFDCVVDVEFVQKGPKNSISSFFVKGDQKLIGIDILIYVNSDQKFESIEYIPSEIGETIEYIKDIYSEIDEEFTIKIIPQNIEAKDFRHIDVQIFKKSNIPYKIDDETGEEIEDWSNYKPSTFKLSEIMSTILTSKSYIESIDGVISKIWIHVNGRAAEVSFEKELEMSIDALINRQSCFLPGKKAWEVLEIKQISIKYSI
jgi:hypothetical protein